MAGSDAFDYNRFDELDKLYRSLYEEKKEESEDEDDVSPKEKKAIGDAVKDHTKEKHEEDDDSDEHSDEDHKEKDDKEDDSEDDEKTDGKKFPSFLKKSEKEDVKEAVIAYLMDEGFVNNEVSAEVMVEHMNPEWMKAILEGK